MDVDVSAPAISNGTTVDREKTAPFLIRTFVKIGSFHRLTLFEDGTLPTTDEQQLFTWKDATLREVLTTLRATAPHIAEYRHPLARFSFRTVYADGSNKGRFAQKELGMVYSRDILGEPGTLQAPAPRLQLDSDPTLGPAYTSPQDALGDATTPTATQNPKERDTLDSLRFVPGDYLLVAVLLPKNVTLPSEISIKGSSAGAAGSLPAPSASWKAAAAGGAPGRTGDAGWGRAAATASGGTTRGGGGHWRGGPDGGRGGRGGGRGDRDRDLDRDRDRVPPPRRSPSPPPRRGGGGGDGWGPRGGRGGRGGDRDRDRRTPSRSRSRSPPRRRRYD